MSRVACALTSIALILSPVRGSANDAEQYVTDFSTLYDDWGAFHDDVGFVTQRLETIGELEGRAKKSARDMAYVFEQTADLTDRAEKLLLYGILTRNVDTTSDQAQSGYDIATALSSRADAAVGFLSDDVTAIPASTLQRWMESEPRLQPYRVRLRSVIALADHRLPAEQELLVADLERSIQLSADEWTALMEAPIGWPELALSEGSEVADSGAYRRYRRSPSTAERRSVVKAHLSHLGDLAEPFGLLYTRRVEGDWRVADYRGFETGPHAFWAMREEIPPGVSELLVEEMLKMAPLVRRYVQLRARALDIDDFEYADLLARPPGIEGEYSVGETIDRLINVYAEFGPERQAALREVVQQPLLHLAPSDVKSAEWGIVPGVGGSEPYLRMNYQGEYLDSRRLAAGLTTLLTFYERLDDISLSGQDSAISPGLYGTYLLYDEYGAKQAETQQQRIAFLLSAADQVYYSLFRNILFNTLDREVESRIAAGKPPTGAEISEIYLSILKDYYGDLPIDPVHAHEWMTQFVPFLNYAHHNWPLSVVAATSVIQKNRNGDESAADAFFKEVTDARDSDRIFHVLRESGLDLSSPEPYQMAGAYMRNLLDQLEAAIEAR
ncbi:hypothetical protein PUV54_05955 [Hyphococcus flavus]|uniref:Oligopeptidase F N-terminal domain-containing protein n=1 Tax=Hyphococcus flavus TaxID=1866326 RepID=A0AAE9ZD56_9PROT|nr:hypothetical protein [Hyphococcus flavus]WDI32739.1 hypothetical protein PUV54_05955 [Hyphococcus flavus]